MVVSTNVDNVDMPAISLLGIIKNSVLKTAGSDPLTAKLILWAMNRMKEEGEGEEREKGK